MHAPAAVVAERLPAAVGPVVAVNDHTCRVQNGSDNVEMLAVWLGMLGADFEVSGAPELTAQFRLLAKRFARAAGD